MRSINRNLRLVVKHCVLILVLLVTFKVFFQSSLQLLIDTIVNTYDTTEVPPMYDSLKGWTSNAVLLTPHQLMQLVEFLLSINVSLRLLL